VVVKEDKAACASCGFKSKKKPSIKSSEKLERKDEIAIVKSKDEEVHPVVDMKCKKCGNKKCYFWTMQTRASDESETKFYKCAKCSHTWRVYR